MSFSKLNQLNNRLVMYKSKLEKLRQELSEQKERKSNIESIISSFKRACAFGYEEINRYENRIISDFSTAIKGNHQSDILAQKVRNKLEKNIDDDNYLNPSWSFIQRELTETNEKINNLNNTINYINDEIESTKAQIRIIKRNIIDSFLQEYKDSLNKFNVVKTLYSNNPTSEKLKSDYDNALNQKNAALNQYNYYKNNL